jgi:hypothetical protein
MMILEMLLLRVLLLLLLPKDVLEDVAKLSIDAKCVKAEDG